MQSLWNCLTNYISMKSMQLCFCHTHARGHARHHAPRPRRRCCSERIVLHAQAAVSFVFARNYTYWLTYPTLRSDGVDGSFVSALEKERCILVGEHGVVNNIAQRLRMTWFVLNSKHNRKRQIRLHLTNSNNCFRSSYINQHHNNSHGPLTHPLQPQFLLDNAVHSSIQKI